jgi:hypothetical protein
LHQEFSAAQGQSAVPAASFTLRTIVSKKDAEASEVAHVSNIRSMVRMYVCLKDFMCLTLLLREFMAGKIRLGGI